VTQGGGGLWGVTGDPECFIFSQSTAALLRRKSLSSGSSRDTYRAQESDKIKPDAFPQLVYLTSICHLWILASSLERCTCTNSWLVGFPQTLGRGGTWNVTYVWISLIHLALCVTHNYWRICQKQQSRKRGLVCPLARQKLHKSLERQGRLWFWGVTGFESL